MFLGIPICLTLIIHHFPWFFDICGNFEGVATGYGFPWGTAQIFNFNCIELPRCIESTNGTALECSPTRANDVLIRIIDAAQPNSCSPPSLNITLSPNFGISGIVGSALVLCLEVRPWILWILNEWITCAAYRINHGTMGDWELIELAELSSSWFFNFLTWFWTSLIAFSTNSLLWDSPTGLFSRITSPPVGLMKSSFMVPSSIPLVCLLISIISSQSSLRISFCRSTIAGSC